MSLFGSKKNSTTGKNGNCCCGNMNAESMENARKEMYSGAAIKVLGSGCAKCNELEANVKAALIELGFDSTIDHVTDFSQIAAYGVMSTPALVVHNKVVSYGKVLKKEEALAILKNVQG